MNELSILAAATEAPSRDCLVAEGRAWSYAELAERSRAAIRALADHGVRPGQRVALTVDADVDSVVWLYALFELGCPAVLLHPRYTKRERDRVLDEATPVQSIQGMPPPREPFGEPDPSFAPIRPGRILAVVQTSGSAGRARGACLSRRAFLASAAAHTGHLGWLPHDRWLLSMPPAHVGGLSILTRSLIARRCVVLSPGRFDPVATMRVMHRDRITLASVVPTMLRRLLACDDPVWAANPELRAVLVGGAPFPDRLRREAASRGIPALATYGCTEACSQITTQSPGQSGTPGCGKPLRGIELRIDEQEIQVRGEILMDGYLGDVDSVEPWTSDGWLRTGDLGEFSADGQLLVRGRLDDLIVSGGENVAPQEVESWLETIPGVLGACVFGIPDEEWGQQLVAALATDASRYDPKLLRSHLAEGLAPYKRPKQICLVDAMPLNRSGKVDRAAVVARCRDRLRSI